MPTPKVTFIIASYNYQEFLPKALHSLVRQWNSDHPFNILVIEDGSSDNSLGIAKEFSSVNDYITVITHKNHVNKGLSESLNLALKYASTEWIAFLESDDVSKPDSVQTIFNILENNTSGLFFFDIDPVLESKASRGWFDAYVPRIKDWFLKNAPEGQGCAVDKEILKENFIPTFSCAVVRKNLLEDCSFNCPVPAWIDWFLWIQIAQQTKVRFIDKKLVFWRIHNTSQNNKKNLTDYLIQYRIFRLAVRKRLLEMDVEDRFSKISYLSLPVIIPLGIRFFKMARYAGFRKVIKQIYGRLLK